MDNMKPWWTLIDALDELVARRGDGNDAFDFRDAEALAARLRRDIQEVQPDLVETFNIVIQTLKEASQCLDELADRDGHTVTRQHASKARVIARRCYRAWAELGQVGEL